MTRDRVSRTPVFVSEVSSNHQQDLDRCLAFVRTSAEMGCDAVKFQLFKLRRLFAPEILKVRKDLLVRETWELPVGFLPDIARACREHGIQFSCTPFYLDAVEELSPFVDFLKIASYELIWDDLLRECGRAGKPVVLSTGMATLDEIDRAVDVVRGAGCRELTLLHCISGYPCPPADCNLAAIATLRGAFPSCVVGWSDHSVNVEVVRRAVTRWGAEMIEFHLDLEGGGAEFKAGHCWLPGQIAPLIAEFRRGQLPPADPARQLMDGDGNKEPAASEKADRDWRRDPVDGLRPLRSTRSTV